jgi:GNAT superfamily N-acetyltransferase
MDANLPLTATDGFMRVPPGKVATIVTSLEMTARPATLPPVSPMPGRDLTRVAAPEPDWYRRIYRKVGEDWLWFSRLRLSDDGLAAIIQAPDVAVYVLRVAGDEAGLLELDFRIANECEITFFGLTAAHVGQGLGGHLMRGAIEQAWSHPIARLWVHTCTLDHPAALSFYRRMGFHPYLQEVEIADDPRILGEIPRTAAPQIPIFDLR